MNRSPTGRSTNRDDRPPAQPIDRIRRIMVIALIISSLFVIVVVGIGLALAFITASSSNPSALTLPYNSDSRPLPDSANASADLPRTVGRFTQTSFSGNLNHAVGQLSAGYGSGVDTIQISLDLNANNAQGLANFTRRLGTIKQSGLDTAQALGVAYAKAVDPTTHAARLIYLKQYWLIDVTANSQAALDAFMAAYPY